MDATRPGILIAFEGIDGAGKTTQAALLADFFRSAGEKVLQSKEPTDGPWGRKIRESAANGRMSLKQELAAFVADRREHVRDKVRPALDRGETVLLDRYFYSTIAYQGSRGEDADSLLKAMLDLAPEPDAVILLDVPPEIGIARIQDQRGEKPNAFEDRETLKLVRQAFLQLAGQRANIIRIDGTPSAPYVRQQILDSLVKGVLKKLHCAKHWGCDDPFHCVYRMAGECRWAKMVAVSAACRTAV